MSGWSQNRFRTRDHNSTVTYYGSWFRINGIKYILNSTSDFQKSYSVCSSKKDNKCLRYLNITNLLLTRCVACSWKYVEKWNQKRSNNSIKREISHSLCFTSHNWGSKKNICLLDTKQTRDEFQENHHDFRHFAFFLSTDTDVLPLRTKSNKRSPSKVSRHECGNGDGLPERCVLLNRWTNGFTIQNHSDGGKIIFKNITLPSWNP